MRYSCARVVILLSLVIASPALAVNVALGPGTTVASAGADSDNATPVPQDFAYPTSIPESGTVSASEGTNTSATEFDLSNSALVIRFDHSRDAANDARSFGSAAIYFTVSEDIDYLLSGTYSASDTFGRLTQFKASLFDETLGTVNYDAFYDSRYTPNESFTLGQYGGDTVYNEYGALSGTLVAGHQYRFLVDAGIRGLREETPSRADATGLTSLIFVPEPSTGLLVIAGLLGFAIRGENRTKEFV
jgi:hypothetical protein